MGGRERITPLTVVFRAGRAGAQTDHSAIFYNVDMKTGKITRGGSNAHWYEVGLKKVTSEKKAGSWTKQGVFLGDGFTKRREAQGKHPDTGMDLVGKQIPQLQESLDVQARARRVVSIRTPCRLGCRLGGRREWRQGACCSAASRGEPELQLFLR